MVKIKPMEKLYYKKTKNNSVMIFFLILVFSCQISGTRNLFFEGELIAKNLISVQQNLPARAVNTEYSWFIAPSADGEWTKLDGIWTNEIVLLTSYVGSYIRCDVSYSIEGADKSNTVSVVSERPVEYRGNPNTDWFRDAGYGIMAHYLKEAIVPDGGLAEWNEAVNSFDVEKFAEQAHSANAGYVMFTLGQNSGYYCAPNAAFDKALGIKPGDLCSDRDLPMDLIRALKKYDIPLILYLPCNPPVNNPLVSEKFIYSYKKDSATSQFNQPILEEMIREWSLRYGGDAKGWWFDGLYPLNNIRSTRMDMSLKHNISTNTLAAKAGNKSSIVTYNYGFGKIQVNTPYCDYSSGESSPSMNFLKAVGWKTGYSGFCLPIWVKNGEDTDSSLKQIP
jgi:hypothetical protein